MKQYVKVDGKWIRIYKLIFLSYPSYFENSMLNIFKNRSLDDRGFLTIPDFGDECVVFDYSPVTSTRNINQNKQDVQKAYENFIPAKDIIDLENDIYFEGPEIDLLEKIWRLIQ